MLARRLEAILARRGIHYAWVVGALTFLTMLTTAGAMGLPGALILPLSREYGWSTATISSALALRIMLFGLMAPFSAAFMLRFGLRAVIVTAVALISAGLLLATAMTAFWHLLVLWGVVVGLGTGLTAMVLGATVANRWFVKSRGLVLGLLTASAATGQLAFLPLATMLVERVGWRAAVFPTVAACVAVAALVALFMVDRPESLGLGAYGEEPGHGAPAPAVGGPGPVARAFAILAEASRVPAFWALFGTFFICGLSTNGLIQSHFIAFCADYQLKETDAASVLALMGIFDFFGTVASGWLSDRFDNRWLLFWYYGLRGLSLLWLPSSTFTFYGLSIFALFYGLDWIATVPPTVRLSAKLFGREKGPLVFGWIFTGHQIGAAFATYAAGAARTGLGNYLPAFYGAGAMCLVAALGALTAGRRRADVAMTPVATP
ncbi:MFS transporter [Lichenibacterium ramalinae]|uniref:MFS transporter n=1 Tax=Lichenibacterium ramalinae TaxID=2316527 RepID=A0A4Q2REK6_9HYPH|nr:MFS transporter [Lichenibacterium ramalinae]RYB05591.1 MFS transporter [Lichenibacterium ramalinae]